MLCIRFTLITALLLLAVTTHAAPPPMAAPKAVDLGKVVASSAGEGSFWLVNTSDQPLHVDELKGTCGCIRFKEPKPSVIDPQRGVAVHFTMDAPPEIGKKEKVVRVMLKNHDPVEIKVKLDSVASESSRRPRRSGSPLVAVPTRVDFGLVDADTMNDNTVWIVNGSDQPVDVASVRGSCSCMYLPPIEPRTLAPGGAMPIAFSMEAPKEAGKPKYKTLTVIAADGRPLGIPVVIERR